MSVDSAELGPDLDHAVRELWKWVVEQKSQMQKRCMESSSRWAENRLDGFVLAYDDTLRYMKMLFKGLIDFEE